MSLLWCSRHGKLLTVRPVTLGGQSANGHRGASSARSSGPSAYRQGMDRKQLVFYLNLPQFVKSFSI